MKRSTSIRVSIIIGLLTGLIVAFFASPCMAQATAVLRVEEDWELVVGTPSANNDAPQVTCVMSPLGDADVIYTTFMVNHHDMPTFAAGGLQVQAWNGGKLASSKQIADQTVLATPGETIRWTQSMSITPDGLVFQVLNGTSTTWGEFGGDSLKLVVATTLTNLNAYSPTVSVEHSNISFASNRVQSLVLKSVRVYGETGLLGEDNNPRVVFPKNQ